MNFKLDSFSEYIGFQIEMLYLLKIRNPKIKIDRKVKDFYIYNIYLNAVGIDITTYEAAVMLSTHMKWKGRENVHTYRAKLKRKGWFSPDSNNELGYNVLPVFRNIDVNNLTKIYNITISTDVKFNNIVNSNTNESEDK